DEHACTVGRRRKTPAPNGSDHALTKMRGLSQGIPKSMRGLRDGAARIHREIDQRLNTVGVIRRLVTGHQAANLPTNGEPYRFAAFGTANRHELPRGRPTAMPITGPLLQVVSTL